MTSTTNPTRGDVLVTVKAYPTLSQRYRETVCVAGVRLLDDSPGEWCRLYPVPFRDLDDDHRFAKYDVINVSMTKPRDDTRPESLRADADSITVVRHIGTHDGWRERRRIIEPLIAVSMCQVQRDQAARGTSLAAVRPVDVSDVIVEPAERSRPHSKEMIAAQSSLFNQGRPQLEAIPWCFRYHYRCSDHACKGHKQMIIDWELGQCYRQLRGMSQADRVRCVREKWLNELCSRERDPLFFVGNMHQAPRGFLVLGVFWPPRGPDQLILF